MASDGIGNFASNKPYFNGSDYTDWKLRMEFYLDSEGVELWDVILKEFEYQHTPRDQWDEACKKHNYRNKKAMTILLGSMEREEKRIVSHCVTAHSM